MARQKFEKSFNTFVKGLMTEASEINFPENFSLYEKNFLLHRDGGRDRRKGMELVYPLGMTLTSTLYPIEFDDSLAPSAVAPGVREVPVPRGDDAMGISMLAPSVFRRNAVRHLTYDKAEPEALGVAMLAPSVSRVTAVRYLTYDKAEPESLAVSMLAPAVFRQKVADYYDYTTPEESISVGLMAPSVARITVIAPEVVALLNLDSTFEDQTGKVWDVIGSDWQFDSGLELSIPPGSPASNYLSIGQNEDFNFTGDFTIECFVRSDLPNQSLDILATNRGSWTSTAATFRIENGRPRFVAFGPPVALSNVSLPVGERVHISCCRRNSDLYMSIDGEIVLHILGYTGIPIRFDFMGTVVFNYLGYANVGPFNGAIDNLRVVKGAALYTSPYTPPTTPLSL